MPRTIVITDPQWTDDELVTRVRAALAGAAPGSVGVQVRDKARPARLVLALSERLSDVCREHGAPLYVNDRLDIALAVGADGVHLGDRSVKVGDARALLGPKARIFRAAHELLDVEEAKRAMADGVVLSPIFVSPGKGAPRGVSFIAEALERAGDMPIYALGGVDESNASLCIEQGAYGVAVIRAVLGAPDPGRAVHALLQAVCDGRDGRHTT